MKHIIRKFSAIMLLIFALNILVSSNLKAQSEEHKIKLTTEEEAWIKEHPVVRLGIGESWAPFVYPAKNGDISGFDVDMLDILSARTGIIFELVPGNWHEIVEQAKTYELDGLAESTYTAERAKYFLPTEVYNTAYYALVTTPDKLEFIRSEADLAGKTLVHLKGNAWTKKIINSLENVKEIEVDSEEEAFQLVLDGKADASFIVASIYIELQKVFHANIQIAYFFDKPEQRTDLLYSIRKDWPELVSIMNRVLADLSVDERMELAKKWVGFVPSEFERWINLNEEELAWLKKHPVIRIAPDPMFPPIEWLDEAGKYRGIAADFMELISDNLNVKFDVVQCSSWDEVLQKAKAREVDLLPAASQTPDRAKYMDFSEPYLVFPGVIITTKKNINLKNSTELIGKNVGIVNGYVWEEFIRKDYPGINIVTVKNIPEGLKKVSTYEIDAFIVVLPIALYYIEQEGYLNLVVAGETEYSAKLSIHTRNDWPILNSIINKVLKQIPQHKKKKIIRNWINLKPHSIFSYQIFWIILLFLLVSGIIISVISLWNRALKKQVKLKTFELQDDIARREKVETELAASKEKYKLLISNQIDLLVEVDSEGRFMFVNSSYCEAFGKTEEELLGKTFMPLVHPDDVESTMEAMKALQIPPYSCYLEQRAQTVQGWRWLAWMDKAILDDKGNITRIIGLGRDITQQKETEMKISRIAREWEQTFDAANDAFWILDKDNKIIRSNLTAAKMFNQEVTALIGRQCWDIVHQGDKHILGCPFKKSRISLNRESMELEIEDRWYKITVDPILNEKGEFNGAVHIVSDVTEKKKLELKLADYRANLEELVKERTAELVEKNDKLKHFNQLFIGREFRIKELKEKLKNLEKQ